MGYVRTVVKRQIAASIDIAVQQRRNRVISRNPCFTSPTGGKTPSAT